MQVRDWCLEYAANMVLTQPSAHNPPSGNMLENICMEVFMLLLRAFAHGSQFDQIRNLEGQVQVRQGC